MDFRTRGKRDLTPRPGYVYSEPMRHPGCRPAALVLLAVCLIAAALRAGTDETVTIPRARYEELLRKEEELARLRAKLTPDIPDRPSATSGATRVLLPGAGASGEAAKPSPPPDAANLPPLPEDGRISAPLLAEYFLRDPATAAARLQNRNLQVIGRVVGFEKPWLTRNYQVLLETDQPAVRVRAVVEPPQGIRGAYVAQGGTVLMVADASGQRRPLLRLGDTATVEGRVKGLRGNVVEMSGCRLLPRP